MKEKVMKVITIVLALVIIGVAGFAGYKIYNSSKERDKKLEELQEEATDQQEGEGDEDAPAQEVPNPEDAPSDDELAELNQGARDNNCEYFQAGEYVYRITDDGGWDYVGKEAPADVIDSGIWTKDGAVIADPDLDEDFDEPDPRIEKSRVPSGMVLAGLSRAQVNEIISDTADELSKKNLLNIKDLKHFTIKGSNISPTNDWYDDEYDYSQPTEIDKDNCDVFYSGSGSLIFVFPVAGTHDTYNFIIEANKAKLEDGKFIVLKYGMTGYKEDLVAAGDVTYG